VQIWFCDHIGTHAIWHGTFVWPSATKFSMFQSEQVYGKGVFQALPTSELHWIEVLPVMFPLPFAHGLPIGQIFSP
jgi:hypothetical protein